MTLPSRLLGRTGLEITTLGFGAWAIGGDWTFGWGPQGDADSIAAMRRALSLGINWIDTAAVYGLGHSERLVGQLLRQIPTAERPLIFTKCGMVWDESDPKVPPRQTLEPSSIRKECEASLRRLGVDRIDLYQFHWPDASGVAVEDSWAEMERLKEQGKVRFAGVSNFPVELLERCEALHPIASLQPPLSMIRRGAALDVIPWCSGHRVGVICYSPMQAGLLTDHFTVERMAAMPRSDWRQRSAEFQPGKLERNLALRDALRPIAARHGVTTASIAVAWVLAWQGVTGAIVGARSAEQVDGWISGARVTLAAADLDEIAAAIARTGAGAGPMRPL
jgi:aryl-alcohol dehydrogenase-like predicted oxidoreductase